MSRARLAVAAGSRLAATAAAEIGRSGGNSLDACVAAAVMAWVAEPFMCSLGGSGFITVRDQQGAVRVFDGNNAVPLEAPVEPGQGLRRTFLENYSNGMYTGIGGGSVAVPGVLAALRSAWEAHGALRWEALFSPAIEAAESGIPLPATSAYYLSETWDAIWSVYPEASALLGRDGIPLREGDVIRQPDLAETLRLVATEGPGALFGGELGRAVAGEVQSDGGLMTVDDLVGYRCEVREPVTTDVFGWRVQSNPPPSVGGAVLAHMLALLEGADLSDPLKRMRAIVEAETAALGYRKEAYEDPGEIAAAFHEALERLRRRGAGSASTTHTSTADPEGLVCSLTQSNGYGSGLVVRGVFMNNTLGEEELNPRGAHGLAAGSRCHSNMTPTIATRPGLTVGLGSPGADRIVGAIAQTFLALALDDADLATAVATPRAHLAAKPEGPLLCFEDDLPGVRLAEEMGYRPRPYEGLHMFFGAVQAASCDDAGNIAAVHDPRRSGGSAVI
ncbi:MAG: gamma-glutamyltransferase [Actinomycetota bacterium]|nr:gamma-glutamyltransferase [Actinomycetota bacterium]